MSNSAFTVDGIAANVTGTSNRITVTQIGGFAVVDIAASYVGQTSLTTLGTIGTGTWQASVVAGAYGGTGHANTGLTINLGSATSGYVLTSDSSGNATWQANAALGGVTSIAGTSNQITASASTGAVTLSFPNGLSLGSYQATTPPTGGMIIPGQVFIGETSTFFTTTTTSFEVGGVLTPSGSQTNYAINAAVGTFASGVTNQGTGYFTDFSTAAASFALTSLYGFRGQVKTIGSGSSVTNAYCFYADSTFNVGGTLSAAFAGNFSAGTGAYNCYMPGSAHNYMLGALGLNDTAPGTNALLSVVGGAQIGFSSGTASLSNGLVVSGNMGIGLNNPNSNVKVFIGGSVPTTNANTISVYVDQTLQTTGTGQYLCFASNPNTVASSFTSSSIIHFNANQGTFGSGSTVTNQVGFFANSSLTGGTNNYAFQGMIGASGTSNYNCYMNGSAPNYFAGSVLQGLNASSSTSVLQSVNNGTYNSGETGNHGFQTWTSSTFSGSYTLLMGADATNHCSYIQSIQSGVNTAPLILNASGGGVGVGIAPSAIAAGFELSVGMGSTGGIYTNGVMQYTQNATGTGSALLGANSPAITNTAPYTWLKMISSDGSTIFVPAWK